MEAEVERSTNNNKKTALKFPKKGYATTLVAELN
jgi:hypothetical protein